MPIAYEALRNNINFNEISNLVTSYNLAVGRKKASDQDTMNHVVIENEYSGSKVAVPVESLDVIICSIEISENPFMIKIDVKGFETDVIAGMEKILANQDLNVIIIKLSDCGAAYGFDDNDINNRLTESGFYLVEYDGINRIIRPIKFELNKDNAI